MNIKIIPQITYLIEIIIACKIDLGQEYSNSIWI